MHPSVYDHMSVADLFFYLFISETAGKQDLRERIVKIPSAQILHDKATFAYLMDKDQSVDIDDATDFMLAEFLMKTQGNRYP